MGVTSVKLEPWQVQAAYIHATTACFLTKLLKVTPACVHRSEKALF